jgi:hypothetical protein
MNLKNLFLKLFDGIKFSITVPIHWTGYTRKEEVQNNAKKTADKTRRKLLGEEGGFV